MNGPERAGNIAAFFDLDGTLIAPPSLERRFFAKLRDGHAIPTANYLRWSARAIRLAPQGIGMVRHANKMYLRDVHADDLNEGYAEAGQERSAAPGFFPAAVDQVARHAEQGHAIVLVSGTLAPLARAMGLALVLRLAVRGIAAPIAVCATQLEEKNGRWTGEIVGHAMFGEAKAGAIRRLAEEAGFDLAKCYAYGDSESDRWMLEAVGRACVVNSSKRMQRFAERRGWSIRTWGEKDANSEGGEEIRAQHVVNTPETLV